jgi:hypothetical protein
MQTECRRVLGAGCWCWVLGAIAEHVLGAWCLVLGAGAIAVCSNRCLVLGARCWVRLPRTGARVPGAACQVRLRRTGAACLYSLAHLIRSVEKAQAAGRCRRAVAVTYPALLVVDVIRISRDQSHGRHSVLSADDAPVRARVDLLTAPMDAESGLRRSSAGSPAGECLRPQLPGRPRSPSSDAYPAQFRPGRADGQTMAA